MLYPFKRYMYISKYNSIINVLTSKATRDSKVLRKYLVTYKTSRVVHYSTFFRKSYFRTLLIQPNFSYTTDQNVFYFPRFIDALYSTQHPSFFYKKLGVK
jgi:hypothetical protein